MSVSYQDLSAYPTPVDFSGNLQRWHISESSPEVIWDIKANDIDAESLEWMKGMVQESAELWSQVPQSYLVLREAAEEESSQITIHFETTMISEASAGYAEFDQVDDKGRPIHCSVHVGGAMDTDQDSLSKTILHEMGHCLGLGHSLVPASIMSYDLEKNSFSLDLDDEAAISRLYPKGQSNPKLPPGCVLGLSRKKIPGIFLGFLCIPFILISVVNASTFKRSKESSPLCYLLQNYQILMQALRKMRPGR